MKNEIIIYQPDDITARIDVRIEDETVWLTQAQLVELFNSCKANINEHIKNIFQMGELDKKNQLFGKFEQFERLFVEGLCNKQSFEPH